MGGRARGGCLHTRDQLTAVSQQRWHQCSSPPSHSASGAVEWETVVEEGEGRGGGDVVQRLHSK